MSILKQNVGIDISMEGFSVNLSVLDASFEKRCLGSNEFSNTSEGFKKFLGWVEKTKDPGVAEAYTMEYTGVYYEQLAYYLLSKEKPVNMVIPSKAKKYFESLPWASKTDKLDAKSLSWLGLERNLKRWNPISDNFRRIRFLTREREELLKERTMVSNRMHADDYKAFSTPETRERYHARMDLLKEQVEQIEQEIRDLIATDEELDTRIRRLETIPGVGFVTAATIVAETNGFAAITNQKQLTSYAGLDVKLRESGKYKGKARISKQGNSHLRRILYFPAQVAAIHNKPLSVFYERVKGRKHKSLIAGVAVQRKLLCLMYTLWKTDTVFDPNYEYNKFCNKIKKAGQPCRLPCAG